MALVRKEAGKSQGEVSRGVMSPLEDGSRVILPPKKTGGGQARLKGWKRLADTLSLPEGLGWGW